jgi:hypothetical protein
MFDDDTEVQARIEARFVKSCNLWKSALEFSDRSDEIGSVQMGLPTNVQDKTGIR